MGLMAGCSPSLRMVHQSNAYFERCHAADFDASVSTEDKMGCWQAWVEHYRAGQPPERVVYARERVAALTQGDILVPLPGMQEAAVGPSYAATTYAAGGDEPAAASADSDPPAGADGNGGVASPLGANGQPNGIDPPSAALGGAPIAPHVAAATSRMAPPEPPRVGDPVCANVCEPRWEACVAQCANRPPSCLEACSTEHRTCMGGCF